MILSLHPDKDLTGHQTDDYGHNHSEKRCQPSGIGNETPHVLIILGAEPLSNRNRESGAYTDYKAIDHKVDSGCGANGSQGIHAQKLSYNNGINHAVKLLKQKPHQHGNGESKNQFSRASSCHIFNGRLFCRLAHKAVSLLLQIKQV